MLEDIWYLLAEPLQERSIQKALLGGSLVAISCGVIGCFVILKRMAFLGDALSHAMLAGVTAGYLVIQMVFGRDADAPALLFGSLIAGVLTVFLVGFVSQVSRIKEDTAIGIMYTGMFAFGGMLYSVFSHRIHIDLMHFVMGMVLGIEDWKLWLMAFITVVVLSIVILLFRHLQIATFDPVMAASIGIPVVAMNYLLTACTSLVVVGAVSIVGVILVVGLLVTPAATAYLLCDRLSRMLPLAAFFGTTSVIAGVYASTWVGNVAMGSAIVLMSTLQFVLVLAIAPRYGMIADWWRRKTMVPQQLIEDVLGCFRKQMSAAKTVGEIVGSVDRPAVQIYRAIRSLKKKDWLIADNQKLRLTREGKLEAKRILRAHRLWETYLQHVGLPVESLHDQAHRLEHVHDEATVDYLDDKLGHPLTDPHGSEIPEDFEHLVVGEEVRFSLLREGHAGLITRIEHAAEMDERLAIGLHVRAGKRSSDGKLWTMLLPTGAPVELDHTQTDAVIVRFEPSDN